MKNKVKLWILLSIFVGCATEPDINVSMLDGEEIFDPSLYEPEKYLVSVVYPNPTPQEALKPVVIASHGYTATTFE